MLKLTYTENGFHLEHLTQSLEDWMKTRVLLYWRAATSFYVEPSTASFLLRTDSSNLADLKVVEKDHPEIVSISFCDAEYVEITLKGTWLASDPNSEEGIFTCALSDRAELLLEQLWVEAQLGASVLSE